MINDNSFQNNSCNIYQHAKDNDCSLVESAIWLKSPVINSPDIWDDPLDIDDCIRMRVNLFIDGYDNLLTCLAREISKRVQFPESTILLHSLGVVASAMCKSFKVDYDGDIYPVNLYCVTAQPPSTGKSGVNNILTKPISSAYNEINKDNKNKRHLIEREIKELSKQIEKNDLTDAVMLEKLKAMDDAQERLSKCPIWNPFFTQATIEALDETASKQTGMFNICSAEAESMTVVLGNVYSDDKSSKNYGLILSAWDGERVSGGRVSRESTIGEVRGSITVIAQDESVRAVLTAANDRGVAERFLLLAEPDLLGKRDHTKRYKMNTGTVSAYEKLIKNIVFEDDVTLKVSTESIEMLQNMKQAIEPDLAEGGKFSSNLLRGVLGKADKQVIKIASVLHAVDNWQSGGEMSKIISLNYIEWAIEIYDVLSKSFIQTADSMEHAGSNTEIKKAKDYLIRCAEKNKNKISVRSFYDAMKNQKCFHGISGLMGHLKKNTLTRMVDLNFCYFDGSAIYINPRLK